MSNFIWWFAPIFLIAAYAQLKLMFTDPECCAFLLIYGLYLITIDRIIEVKNEQKLRRETSNLSQS